MPNTPPLSAIGDGIGLFIKQPDIPESRLLDEATNKLIKLTNEWVTAPTPQMAVLLAFAIGDLLLASQEAQAKVTPENSSWLQPHIDEVKSLCEDLRKQLMSALSIK